jgi:phage tail sheath protein FI
VLDHCGRVGTRFALLDAFPGATPDEAGAHARRLRSLDGAMYFPWIDVGPQAWLPPAGGGGPGTGRMGPPCGHVAGIVSRSDARTGVHKAPANEVVEEALDLETRVGDAAHGALPRTLNVIRAFPGRGIRVWGARTLGGDEEPAWAYVPVRRLFLTVGRWIQRSLAQVAFEPQGQALWTRVEREVGSYLAKQHARGALRGATPMQSFYVRCDASTNPPALRDLGQVVTEVGLAPGTPSEFVVVRITHGAGGVTISGPTAPA